MPQKISELESGGISVRVRSRRGTGTRDQDEVIVEAIFDDLDQAERESGRLNKLVRERIADARKVGDPSNTSGADQDDLEVSKVYLGDGSTLSGWIPLPREIVFKDIAPLAYKNQVGTSDVPGIKMNFSSDVPNSGWQEVDAGIVESEIEPLVMQHRLDED